MRIEEVAAGTPITLHVNINNEELTFESTIAEVYPKKRLVLAQAIYRDEKIVTFRAKNILIDIIVNTGDKPFLFKNVTVTLMKKPDGTLCYNLSTLAEGKPFNRRENFRCFIGRATSMQCGPNRSAYDAMIRDVSVTGFSVICYEQVELEERQVIHAVLNDFIEETQERFTFHLYGLVARTQQLDNGTILYGCRLNSYVPGLEAYIMKKERMRLKRTNGGNL